MSHFLAGPGCTSLPVMVLVAHTLWPLSFCLSSLSFCWLFWWPTFDTKNQNERVFCWMGECAWTLTGVFKTSPWPIVPMMRLYMMQCRPIPGDTQHHFPETRWCSCPILPLCIWPFCITTSYWVSSHDSSPCHSLHHRRYYSHVTACNTGCIITTSQPASQDAS